MLTDGKTLCIDSRNGAVGIDADSGRRKYILPRSTAGALLSPDRRVVATVGWTCDPTTKQATQVSLWDFADGSHPRQVDVPFSYERPAATFSADSALLRLHGARGQSQNLCDRCGERPDSIFVHGESPRERPVLVEVR